MFAEPTIDDFLDRLRRRLADTTAELNRAIGAIVSDHASRGILVSSTTVQRVWEEALKSHTIGVQQGFEDLTHAIATMKLDPHLLRQTAVDELGVYNAKVKSIAEGKTATDARDEAIQFAGIAKDRREFRVSAAAVRHRTGAGRWRAFHRHEGDDTEGRHQSLGKAITFERRHDVLIKAKRAAVFDYVTNPKKWPEWMPAALKVNYEDHTARLGEVFQQQWNTGKGPVDLDWLVIAATGPDCGSA